MPILELSKVSKRYGAIIVADAVDLTLAEDEALGIIGPNGAGKTSLFNLIAGTVPVDSGSIRFCDQDITRLPTASRCRLGLSRTFQIPRPFAGLTAFENVVVGAAFGGQMSERSAHSRAVHALDLAGLLGKANVLGGSLTLLERKRLELARALASGPKLLLLDEIAGGLTEHECQELVASIRTIRESSVAIIWIEHIVHALLAVVDRLIVVNFGRKIAEGEPHSVMKSREVAEIYLGIEVES